MRIIYECKEHELKEGHPEGGLIFFHSFFLLLLFFFKI